MNPSTFDSDDVIRTVGDQMRIPDSITLGPSVHPYGREPSPVMMQVPTRIRPGKFSSKDEKKTTMNEFRRRRNRSFHDDQSECLRAVDALAGRRLCRRSIAKHARAVGTLVRSHFRRPPSHNFAGRCRERSQQRAQTTATTNGTLGEIQRPKRPSPLFNSQRFIRFRRLSLLSSLNFEIVVERCHFLSFFAMGPMNEQSMIFHLNSKFFLRTTKDFYVSDSICRR